MTLPRLLRENWKQQLADGFVLGGEEAVDSMEECSFEDSAAGVTFRFRYLPHRKFRGDREYLRQRGIMAPGNPAELFVDPQDPEKRPCFLCPSNIVQLFPKEKLLDVRLLEGFDCKAGANFAWIAPHHYTVVSAIHRNQVYSRDVLDLMLALQRATGESFRVIFNGANAGASIPWHFHLQLTTDPLPVESTSFNEARYPTRVHAFPTDTEGSHAAHRCASEWLTASSAHTLNLVVVPGRILVFPRHQERVRHGDQIVGAFELAGTFVVDDKARFNQASLDAARTILNAVNPEQARRAAQSNARRPLRMTSVSESSSSFESCSSKR